jgi:cob(I)alamin adenosyltransferase
MRQGLIHLYTGEGKGKTTAALGLLLRAHGRGLRVVLVQFLKGRDTGELHALNKLPGITVLRHTNDFGFYRSASEQNKTEINRQNNENLADAYRLAHEGANLIVLDEICAAYNNGALDRAMADRLIMEKPFSLELVLTGRNAPQQFGETADYVTEFVKRKHPYDSGIAAREGVEF